MARLELFQKYSIDESHKEWQNEIDNWISVEIYREMHEGQLPNVEDKSLQYILDFIKKCDDDVKYFFSLENAGSMYLTAKRMIYRFSDKILDEINN